MSRAITFNRVFPSYHPRKGEPTYFVEKIWKGMYDKEKTLHLPFNGYWQKYDEAFPTADNYDPLENIHNHKPKLHTIRAGNRWKVGDKFSPRVWSGKPYRSKQITIAPDIEIKKTWPVIIEIEDIAEKVCVYFENKELPIQEVAKNDGLSVIDFNEWFNITKKNQPFARFEGQIICWNANISY